jgi:choline dehydrogenase-like flavoprotein
LVICPGAWAPQLLSDLGVTSPARCWSRAAREVAARGRRHAPLGRWDCWVADRSVMPDLTSVDPSITTMMIGEKCAGLSKEDA